MFYNAENFFDTADDSLTADDDFLPEGLMRWNYSRYKHKTANLYKVIAAAGEWEPPAFVAMCEVENRQVLSDLVYGTWLSKYKYRIVHEDSPDPRGIDVCFIYRPDIVSVIDYKYLLPENKQEEKLRSRSVLTVLVSIGTDTLNIVYSHWPSRRGGVLAREDNRFAVAKLIGDVCDSIAKLSKGRGKVIVAGDFNCSPGDAEVEVLTGNGEMKGCLVNLSRNQGNESRGSYRYRGKWEMIDQVLATRNLLDRREGFFLDSLSVKVFSESFLLTDDPSYPGKMPFATYRGYKYQGGFSDHLPVIVDLVIQ